MLKYAKIVNEKTKQCDVGIGTNVVFYKSIGMVEMEVEQAYDGVWYVKGYAPEYKPTQEEQEQKRANAYQAEVDPITSHIGRLRDTIPMTEEVEEKIAELISEREKKVQEIKERYPYPEI